MYVKIFSTLPPLQLLPSLPVPWLTNLQQVPASELLSRSALFPFSHVPLPVKGSSAPHRSITSNTGVYNFYRWSTTKTSSIGWLWKIFVFVCVFIRRWSAASLQHHQHRNSLPFSTPTPHPALGGGQSAVFSTKPWKHQASNSEIPMQNKH